MIIGFSWKGNSELAISVEAGPVCVTEVVGPESADALIEIIGDLKHELERLRIRSVEND